MDAIRCPRCQRALPSVANFCPQCGLSVRPLRARRSNRPRRGALPVLIVVLVVVAIGYLITRREDRSEVGSSPSTSRQVTFMGIATPARRIVYMCAASTYSRETVDAFLAEMRSSVARLEGIQEFNVCFLACPRANLDRNLLAANRQNKNRAQAMSLRDLSDDSTNRYAAMADVLRQKPDVIYLVADSALGSQMIVDLCKRESGGRIRINTIAVLNRANSFDPSMSFAAPLREIAASTRGVYKVLNLR